MPKTKSPAADLARDAKEAKRRGAARVILHRFHDCAALSILKAPGTVYLDAKAARDMGRAFFALARSIEKERFTAHSFKGADVPAFETSFHISDDSAVKRGPRNAA